VLYALQADVPKTARSAMCRELSRCYEDRARIAFSWSESLFGPFAIVVIGFLVAMTVIGLYLPLLTLLQAIT
jgi:type II secretory pathway component PulF